MPRCLGANVRFHLFSFVNLRHFISDHIYEENNNNRNDMLSHEPRLDGGPPSETSSPNLYPIDAEHSRPMTLPHPFTEDFAKQNEEEQAEALVIIVPSGCFNPPCPFSLCVSLLS